MIHIVVALACEARPFIDFYKLKQTQQSPFEIYQNEKIRLIISGVGAYNSTAATTYLGAIGQAQAWINIGICGHKSADLGSLFLAHKISHPSQRKNFYPYLTIKHSFQKAPLMTLDEPSDNYQNEDLFDMEAYGFYSAALRFTTIEKAFALKVVSDNQNHSFKEITKDLIRSYFLNHIDTLSVFFENLSQIDDPKLSHPELPRFIDCYQPTTTQSHKLKKNLSLLNLHCPSDVTFEKMNQHSSIKELLLDLDQKLFNLEV